MLLVVAVVAGLAALLTALLLTNIFERKLEARTPILRVVELDDQTTDPAEWGKNFPVHYEDYLRTADMEQTLYGGSEAIPNHPTDRDPRNVVSKSKLGTIPHLKRMWAGYAFATDFREERGHAYIARGPGLHASSGRRTAGNLHPLPRLHLRADESARRR